jgi:hypothetical protein
VCAFGDREIDLGDALPKWSDALEARGKVALLFWGPAEPDDPVVLIERMFADREPPRTPDRNALQSMLVAAGLTLVRHTLLRHTISFSRAETLADGVVAASTWGPSFDAQNEAKKGKCRARFFDAVGGPNAPISWQPIATLAIAALPGAEIELPHRPSIKVPLP